jgi:hypothetical protein
VQRKEYLRANAGMAEAGETIANMTTANTASCRMTRNDPDPLRSMTAPFTEAASSR